MEAAIKATGVGISDIGYFDNMLHEDPALRTVMVTSPGEGEGKSITAANLALAVVVAARESTLASRWPAIKVARTEVAAIAPVRNAVVSIRVRG